MKVQLTLKSSLAISALALLCVWGALFYFVVLKARTISEVTQELKRLEHEGLSAENMRESIEQNPASHARVDSYFIASSSLITFIEEVETITSRAGITASIDTLTPDGKAKTVLLSVTIRGSYAALQRFISALEASPRLIRIDSVTLARGVGTKGADWGAKITGTMYAYAGD